MILRRTSKSLVCGALAAGLIAFAAAEGRTQSAPAPSAEDTALGSPYFTLRHDLRRCASPLCGGYFVARVNREALLCADGQRRAECYVSDLDLSALGLDPEQEQQVRSLVPNVLLRGDIVPEDTVFGVLGKLEVQEAWQGHADVTPSGAFYRARDEGIVCITFPCPSFSAAKLNRAAGPRPFAEIDLSGVSADPSDGQAQLREPEGLLLAAKPTVVTGPAGSARGLAASEYYLPLRSKSAACGSRGLPPCPDGSYCDFPPDADCGRADAPGQCEPRPTICPQIFDPVCGCDGVTYPNACFAAGAGVSVEFDGACPEEADRVCGTILGLTCEKGEVCDFGVGQCQVSDAAGVCRTQPDVCPLIFDPVCGCDGVTYGNACEALAAGAQIDFEGSCR